MNVEKLADEIIEKRRHELSKKAQSYPRSNMIMSDLSECERYLTHSVLDYDKKPIPDEDLLARFEAGNTAEREIIRDLEGLGYTVVMSQKPVELRSKDGGIMATGRVDGFLKVDRNQIPFEIKSSHPNIFNQIKTIEDLQKKPWLRKYTYQIQMYLYANNIEQGLLIFTNCLGAWKILPVYLDYGLCEWILQKIERSYENIKGKEYGPRIPYDVEMCGKCHFASVCLNDIINKPADMIDNPELEEDIKRHEELKEPASEYTSLHKKIRETFKDIDKATVGTRWLIQQVPSQRTSYEIPEDVKKEYAKVVPIKRLVIQDLGGN